MSLEAVDKRWRNLRSKLRRCGVAKTTDSVVEAIASKEMPLFISLEYCELLLKQGEYSAAGKVLEAVTCARRFHPLIDQQHGMWLWLSGKRRAAILFLTKQANFWKRSYLFALLAGMHSLQGNTAKAKEYFQAASMLAEQEIHEDSNPVKKKWEEMNANKSL